MSIDSENDCVEVELSNPYSNVPILLLAGGEGKRMKQSAANVDARLARRNKVLARLRENGPTILENIITKLDNAKFEHTTFLTRSGSEGSLIRRYVDKEIQPRSNIKIGFSEENEPLGTAGALNKVLVEKYLTEKVAIVSPSDTDFPFERLPEIIDAHNSSDLDITWVVTSAPGENTQNIGKIIVNAHTNLVLQDLEASEEKPTTGDNILCQTSVGVILVNPKYFTATYSEFMKSRELNKIKPPDLYRDIIPYILEKGENVNTFDIKQPAPDLGTFDRLQAHRSGKITS